MGTGNLFIDKLVKIQRARSVPGSMLKTKLGNIKTETKDFLVENAKKPKSTDWILELDLDESTGIPRQPFRVTRAFKVQSAFPARGKRGRIEFWSCATKEDNLTFFPSRSKGQEVVASVVDPVLEFRLNISNIDAIQNYLDLNTNFYFPVRNIQNIDGQLILDPQVSPPTGKLVLQLLDGTLTDITIDQ